jgi:hypothetical protein
VPKERRSHKLVWLQDHVLLDAYEWGASVEVFRLLLDRCLEAVVIDQHNETVLHSAISRGVSVEALELLIDAYPENTGSIVDSLSTLKLTADAIYKPHTHIHLVCEHVWGNPLPLFLFQASESRGSLDGLQLSSTQGSGMTCNKKHRAENGQ